VENKSLVPVGSVDAKFLPGPHVKKLPSGLQRAVSNEFSPTEKIAPTHVHS
jgi:hypothetical protein